MSEKRKKQKLKPSKIIVAIFLIIFIFLIVFVVAQTLRGVSFSNTTQGISEFFDSLSAGPGYPYEKGIADIEDIEALDNQLIVLGTDKTFLLNTTAKKTAEEQHTYSDPTIRSKGENFLIFDRGSGRMKLSSSSGTVWEKDLKKNILAADLSEDSEVIAATLEGSTKCVMTVFSRDLEKLFQWNCTSGYIADVAISDNGKYFSAIVMSEKNAEILSTLFIFSVKEKEPLHKCEYSNTSLFNVSFTSGNDVVVIGNNLRSTVTLEGMRTDDDIFAKNTLKSVAFSQSGTSLMQFLEYSGVDSNILVMTNKKGQECARVKLDSNVKKIACGEDYFAAVLSDKIVCFNKKGKQVGEISIDNQIEDIVIIGSKCYTFTSGTINRYSVKG